MKRFEVLKVDNCIAKASVFQYSLDEKMTEEFLLHFPKTCEIRIYRNFPKPSYTIRFQDGTRLIGALNDNTMKTLFPLNNPDATKLAFEAFLDSIILKTSLEPPGQTESIES